MPFSNTNAYANITAAATTLVKAGPGQLYSLTLNNVAASSVITIFDSLTGSGTKIGTYTAPAAASTTPVTLFYDVRFATGLTIVSTNTNDITVSFA